MSGVSRDPSELDLSAAWFRRAQGDFKTFIAAFGARMEGAIPGRVTLERKRDGFFSTQSHVVRVLIETEANIYSLALIQNRLVAFRTKSVRGVTLKTEEIPVPDWLQALDADIRRLAEHAGSAQSVLHDFLMS
jgi:hypothetical protein